VAEKEKQQRDKDIGGRFGVEYERGERWRRSKLR
jgi:hypothetical protein